LEARLHGSDRESLKGETPRGHGSLVSSGNTSTRWSDLFRDQTFEAGCCGIYSADITAWEERTWERAPDLDGEKSPEGGKLKSVVGAKQTRQAS
jgi:hypothetical protein